MGVYKASDNAATTLAGSITNSPSVNSITLTDASKFPVINHGGTGTDWSYVTLFDASNNEERVKVTRRDSGSNNVSIVRGTAAGITGVTDANCRTWSSGTTGVACRFISQVANDAFVAAAQAGSDASAAAASAATAASDAGEAVADVAAHIADTTDAHDASAISFSPAGGIAATDVQAALAELDTEKLAKAGGSLTGALNEAQGANIASASTINLTGATGNYTHITGTTSITAVTLAQGAERTVVFDGALTLTNSASLILPSGANITTAAGDSAVFRGEASSVVRCVSYQKANGQAVTPLSQASTAEITAETAVTKYISPDRLKASKTVAKGWVNFDGTLAGTITPRANHNIASVTKNGTGDWTLNLAAGVFADANYSPAFGVRGSSTAWLYAVDIHATTAPTATALRIVCIAQQGGTTAGSDAPLVSAQLFGN